MIEGFDASDYVYNYFCNHKSVMPSPFVKFALLASDLKRDVELNNTTYHQAKNKMIDYWEELMNCSIDRQEKDDIKFVKEIFDSIPD